MSASDRPLFWWAGIATALPRATAIPPSGNRWIDRRTELRWRIGRPPVFPWPRLTMDEARRLARPTTTGLGDLLCAWLMPLTVSQIKGWRLRIPMPTNAGGLHHDAARAALTPEWIHAHFNIPRHAELVAAEQIPAECEWFCTIEPQWYLNACTETSFDCIPAWPHTAGIDRGPYYREYASLARSLLNVERARFFGGDPYLVLHARRTDKGDAHDQDVLQKTLAALSRKFRKWVVISDDAAAREQLAATLRKHDCAAETDTVGHAGSDAREQLIGDFRALAGAAGVVCSVKGGWSSFPYAATRIGGAPLLFTTARRDARVWQMFSAYSPVPIPGVYLGAASAEGFAEAVTRGERQLW